MKSNKNNNITSYIVTAKTAAENIAAHSMITKRDFVLPGSCFCEKCRRFGRRFAKKDSIVNVLNNFPLKDPMKWSLKIIDSLLLLKLVSCNHLTLNVAS